MFDKRVPVILVAFAASLAVTACEGGEGSSGAKTDSRAGERAQSRALTDRDVAPDNLRIGQYKELVRAAFGRPARTQVKRAGSRRFPCDVYRWQAPQQLPADSRFVLLCYKDGKIVSITMPYAPDAPELPRPRKRQRLR